MIVGPGGIRPCETVLADVQDLLDGGFGDASFNIAEQVEFFYGIDVSDHEQASRVVCAFVGK
jgi:hypothetical protein